MKIDPEYGGPSVEDRQALYGEIGLSPQNIREVETLVAGSAKREVARAALTNVPVIHVSRKNGMTRVFESHTCELVHAYELELDPEVLGYYAQVPCRRVERRTAQGKRHVSSATLDFLVLRRTAIELVECKTEQWLIDHQWETECGKWTHPAYAAWANARGVSFSVWSPPVPSGIYQQNLEAIYSVLSDSPDAHGNAVERAIAYIRARPATLDELGTAIPSFTERTGLWMVAHGLAFGPVRSTPAQLSDRFRLFSSKEQASHVDLSALAASRRKQCQAHVEDPILSATATDVRKAELRLQRLEKMREGTIPFTRRMRALQARVDVMVAAGSSALAGCLTNYAKCGNRTRRVLPEHLQAMETVVSLRWNTGKVRRPKDLFYEFEDECRRLGIEPCGRGGLDKIRRSQKHATRALVTGGLRAYQAQRPSTDPRTRSLPPLAYGQVLHIDSSDFDARVAADLANQFPAAKPKFYIGVDGATGMPMCHSLIFGPARTDGLALLLREQVQRHGFLPRMIHLDRGPENRSNWIEEFCHGRISLRYSPTAASAWNGIAETAIKLVNQGVADHLVGSTLPDRFGRAVDGRFKSRRNARTAFVEVCAEFDKVVYGDMPNSPNADDETPTERVDELTRRYGCFGTPCQWSDDFMIQTSIAVKLRGNLDPKRGVRTEEGWYTSTELIEAMRTTAVLELRSDCADPNILYAKLGGKWIKAYHSRIQSASLMVERELQFELLHAPLRRTSARRRREEVARKAHSRRKLAAAAAPSISHLSPAPTQDVEESAPQPKTKVLQFDECVEPFEEMEDFL